MKHKTKKQRKDDRKKARYHFIHGLFPWWGYFEEKVTTPNYDHRKAIGMNTDYWEHLKMNLKCARNHWRKAHGK